MPASPATTPADESDAAPLPSSFTPGIAVTEDEDEPVADTPVTLAVEAPVLEAKPVALLDELADVVAMVTVELALLRVTVLVRVDVTVAVVVPETVSCARARSGRAAARRMLVNCIVRDGGWSGGLRVDPR